MRVFVFYVTLVVVLDTLVPHSNNDPIYPFLLAPPLEVSSPYDINALILNTFLQAPETDTTYSSPNQTHEQEDIMSRS